ncbi:ArnT family glycosyltransferase [Arenimonas sp.]|uniref:ArnT family glycosyltransferase n=1 Tax=Arenimonas sp. TaxID=1872635 RepID=UPI0035ADD91F
MRTGSKRVKFLLLWTLLLLAKLVLAATLQPFGDEAFYAWEGRHPAWVYSDLPGLTAWIAWLGAQVGGPGVFALRLPFVLLGALLPWLVVRITRRWFGAEAGWQAGLLALLMPLGGLMGLLALPDVPMLVAALLCLDAFAALMRRVTAGALVQLALALAMGAFAHYRFALVVLAGAVGLACSPAGRALLRHPGLWLALAVGALAWTPVLAWNFSNAGAGLGFQFVDRHPWQPQWRGLWWPLVQLLLLTPPLAWLLFGSLVECWRRRRDPEPAWGFMLGLGLVAVPGYFVLGFFADAERVTFHWPLAGWLALCCVAPPVLARWRPGSRRLLHALAAAGLALVLAYLAVLAVPAGRTWLAGSSAYADNFSGWDEVAATVRRDLQDMPPGTVLVADNFMLAAQLRLALGRDDVRVLPHPLNDKHGRAVQLGAWGVLDQGARDWDGRPVLLVVEDTARPLRLRLDGYRELCWRAGGLPAARVLNVDHGRKRFLRFALARDAATAPAGGCRLPALAWLETPARSNGLAPGDELRGWALKSGGRIVRVGVLLDGKLVAEVEPGLPRPDVANYWTLPPEDGDRFGFSLRMPAVPGVAAGRAWLGLRLHGADGVVEEWPAQPVQWRPSGQPEPGEAQ